MKLKILITVPLLLVIFIIGCKKFDLEAFSHGRNRGTNKCYFYYSGYKGTLIDLGDNGEVQEYGFCLSYLNKPPTIVDKAISTL